MQFILAGLILYHENLFDLFIRSKNFDSVICIFCMSIIPILYT